MEIIKKIRQIKSISRYRLAKDTGLTYKAILAIENGGDLKLSTLYKIAEALGVSSSELLALEENSVNEK